MPRYIWFGFDMDDYTRTKVVLILYCGLYSLCHHSELALAPSRFKKLVKRHVEKRECFYDRTESYTGAFQYIAKKKKTF